MGHGSVFLLIDVSSYGPREWLQLVAAAVGIFVSVVGAWRTYRFSKAQIAKRLLEYLKEDEKSLKEARYSIFQHLRYGRPLTKKPDHPFYDALKRVIGQIDRGELEHAKAQLDSVAERLGDDTELGKKYASNTNLRTATVYVLLGKVAKDRAEIASAKVAWQNALQFNDTDVEAERYLGELALAGGDIITARRHFSRAYDLAPDDKLLRAQTWEEVAAHYAQQGRPKAELTALAESAPNFSSAEAYDRAAIAYERAGDLADELNRSNQAPAHWRKAFENYRLSAGRDGMAAILKKLKASGEDVSDLEAQLKMRVPWAAIRLTLELSLLATAGALFYLTLR
jgi:tetratricopeptide (TPR) repeat protein